MMFSSHTATFISRPVHLLTCGRVNRPAHLFIPQRKCSTTSDAHVKSWQELPGPRSLPFVGTLYKYLPGGEYHDKNRMNADWKKFQKYGEVVQEEIFPGEVFIHVFHPDDIEEVFRNEGKYPYRGELRATAKYAQEHDYIVNLPNSKGEEWAELRFPAAKEVMNLHLIRKFVTAQDEVAKDLIKVIKENRDTNNQIHLMPELYKFSIEAACALIFSRRLGMMKPTLDSEVAKISESVNGVFEGLYQCTFFWPLHKSGKSKVWKQFVQDMKYVLRMSEHYTLESLRLSNDESNLIQRFRARGMDEKTANGMAQSLFFGAIDTTSNSLYFLLYNLAKNPEKQTILYKSIIDALPEEDSPITPEVANHLGYLKACMKESFRLTPTASGTLRILDKDIVLRNHCIPAGMTLQLHSAVASRRTDVFERPGDFYPERWLRDYSPRVHPFANLPFSHGTRNCLGKRMAEQEILLAITRIVRSFKIEHEGPPMQIQTKLLANPLQDTLKLIDRT